MQCISLQNMCSFEIQSTRSQNDEIADCHLTYYRAYDLKSTPTPSFLLPEKLWDALPQLTNRFLLVFYETLKYYFYLKTAAMGAGKGFY